MIPPTYSVVRETMNHLVTLIRTRTRHITATTALWLLGALLTSANATVPNQLETVQTTALSANSAEIILTLDAAAPTPRIFAVAHPARLAIDLPGTALGVDQRYRQVQAGPVTGLTLAAADRRSRIVVQLTQPVSYDVSRNGNTIRIVVNGQAGAPLAPPPSAPLPAATTQVAAASATPASSPAPAIPATANRVTDIDFRRNAKDAGRVEITLSGVGGAPDVTEKAGKIIAILPNTHVPSQLEKRLDVRDFATPVDYVDVFSRGDNTRIVVTPAADAHYQRSARQLAHKFVLELTPVAKPVAQARQPRDDKPNYTGKKISLSFQKMDIRSVLQIIAKVADVNMVVADNVAGTVTLRLQDVPWDQALQLVLSSHGLGMEQVGNVMKIAPLGQIAERQQAELTAYKATHDLTPLRTEIVQINYARATDIATVIQSGEGKTAMLSERGRVTVDARTNSLLITDTPKRIIGIKQIILQLDNPVRQVLVEARIVEANRGFSRDLGVTMAGTTDSSTGVPVVGGFQDESGFTINLPASASAGSLVTSIISDTFSLDLALNAMESENRGEIISAPRVITTDGQQAVIEQGTEIPYTTIQDDGQTDVEFKEVLLNLTVTPHITPNEHVLLNMELTQDTIADFSVKGEPAIATRRLQTQVLVDNGDTVVLGGIFKQQKRNDKSQIPILGDAPIIGPLFSNTSRSRSQRELLLFITPNILQKTLTSN